MNTSGTWMDRRMDGWARHLVTRGMHVRDICKNNRGAHMSKTDSKDKSWFILRKCEKSTLQAQGDAVSTA